MKLTQHKLLTTFGERIFERGREYFKEQRVKERIKFQNSLWGRVSGSRSEPYRVSISVDEGGNVETRCSCPMRSGCKHAVALALCWTKEPGSFVDATKIVELLEKKSKEELVTLIEEMMRSTPDIIPSLEVKMSTASGGAGINLEAIGRKITHAVCGNLDYYHIHEAVSELEEVREVADSLAKGSKFKEAAGLYLRLVEACVDALENGADDSDGEMGGLAEECVSSFNECMTEIDEGSFRDSLLPRVIRLYEREDYGIETQEMFAGVVTRENMEKIERELQHQLEGYLRRHRGDDFIRRYKKREVKEILIGLYRRIGDSRKALGLALADMEDAEDHALAAAVFIQERRYQEALEIIRKGSRLEDTRGEHQLHDAFLQLIEALIREGRGGEIDLAEALDHVIPLIAATEWGLDVEEYRKIKAMFSKLGAKERLLSEAKEKLQGTAALVEFLLLEGDARGAAKALESVREDRGGLAISIAEMARGRGDIALSKCMTTIALKNGYEFSYSDEGPAKNLIRELLTTAPPGELEDIVRNLKVGKEISMLIAEELSTRAPKLALEVLGDIIEVCRSEKLVTIASKLVEKGPGEAVKLCDMWISKFVPRSHVYYNDTVKMLGIMKRAMLVSGDENGWRGYLSAFKARYKTRKKLIEKIEARGFDHPGVEK